MWSRRVRINENLLYITDLGVAGNTFFNEALSSFFLFLENAANENEGGLDDLIETLRENRSSIRHKPQYTQWVEELRKQGCRLLDQNMARYIHSSARYLRVGGYYFVSGVMLVFSRFKVALFKTVCILRII